MTCYRYCLASLAALAMGSVCHAVTSDEARLTPRWQALDKNRDGKVAFDELDPMQKAMMSRSDLDRDGAISLAEYVTSDLDPGGAGRLPIPENVRLITDVGYADTSDPRQRLDIFVPKTASVKGPLPVIAYVHGGGWSTGSKIMGRSQLFAPVNTGRYAAVSIGYRLSWQDPWPAQIHDVKAAIRWIRANAAKYGFDPRRICAMGPSAGGHIVAKLGLTNGLASAEGKLEESLDQSSNVQCVIDMMGPVDFRDLGNGRSGEVMTLLRGNADLVRDASALEDVDPSDPPFLIIHGTHDPVVDYQQSVKLDAALRKAGVPVFFQTIEGGGHGDFGAALPQINARTMAFLERMFYDPNTSVPTDPLKK